jgi:hypothetical protein
MTSDGRDDRAALVRSELENGLHELDPVEFSVDCQFADGALQAVAWTYIARPRPGTPFLGVRLTQPLTLRGVTLVQVAEDGGVLLRWYIDWLDVLNRAGLNAALRPVPDGEQAQLSDLRSLLR